ncbi:hypothetical protein TREMEDRAFT_62670 [Tremella mesenterica DSM 1558]|uniref:uncharacterized protein n=1 Tax=Tremella mesenterica (strain ATCC 24925 / CBS 8224 / DSM 1558 / NBRC 9311 / NRRL Y-6157 / RJB 2259-6 / UBC 559-6) TaxID=578456 RepID=UPI0003F4A395|nr:uncharacterized protein TREMEDRAFT_62670 [Tremella mesenterica DSM 1558]EIW68957.1 hypothetical protein TREMEDRAFT_62670 [Tremella mesenterica DSM 1558]
MPPHTISPTPTSQGLGIFYSTLSPPPLNMTSNQSQAPHTFTGMGVGPRAINSVSQERRRLPVPIAKHRRSQSPDRPLNVSPQRHATALPQQSGQPTQPVLALRPTHTRHQSAQGFASFSAIPPSPIRPAGPRAPSMVSPRSSIVPRNYIPEVMTIPEFTEKQKKAPSRKESNASSVASTSRHIRPSKSSELLQRIARAGTRSEEAVTSGRYTPLSDRDDRDQKQSASSAISRGSSTSTVQPKQRSRSTTTLSTLPTPHIPSDTPSQGTHQTNDSIGTFGSLAQAPFPEPPPRQNSNHSANTDRQSSSSRVSPYTNPVTLPSEGPFRQPISVQQNRSSTEAVGNKRVSDLSSGTHSKNAVLLSAEGGGMMLAFSPNGDGLFRPGAMIDGRNGGVFTPTPDTTTSDHVTGFLQSGKGQASRSRPWSEDIPSQQRIPGQRGRSLSDGAAILARQGTLLHPASNYKRASAELGLVLGNKSRRASRDRLFSPPNPQDWPNADGPPPEAVRIEAAKRRKARVEIDVMLERECVVEGGEVRGRMEVRVNGGKRSDGLRVGGGKVRVVGFEDLGDARHIFYHQPHSLPIFNFQDKTGPACSLFGDAPDEEGYRLALEGIHNILFNMRLPLNGGAKGSYGIQGKGPSVRYVVVGSVKLMTATGKRSIAHFYRPLVVLPYLNPSTVLAPSAEPIAASVESGLGWSITGEKGKVVLSVALGRRTWVSGQRVWCEVGIRNNSTRKIKSLNLALLQTVQMFKPDESLDTEHSLFKSRKSEPDVDACTTSTQRKRISEEVVEADSVGHGGGHVTGKNWWTGIEPGQRGQWDMSLQIPAGIVSIRRTRLLEVIYTLRVTVNNSIYVDIPITIINFLSIDPPPMPGDGLYLLAQATVPTGRTSVSPLDVQPNTKMYKPVETIPLASDRGSLADPARASSTTLHIDSLLAAGRVRAEAQAQGLSPKSIPSRPMSVGSTYTVDRRSQENQRSGSFSVEINGKQRGVRPKASNLTSYLSDRSGEGSLVEEDEEMDNTDDPLFVAQRKEGRERLAAMTMAMTRDEVSQEDGKNQDDISPALGQFRPLATPSEELYELGVIPSVGPFSEGGYLSVRVSNEAGQQLSVKSRQSGKSDIRATSPLHIRKGGSVKNRDVESDVGLNHEIIQSGVSQLTHSHPTSRPNDPTSHHTSRPTDPSSQMRRKESEEEEERDVGDETIIDDLPDHPGNETLLDHLIAPTNENSWEPPSPKTFDYTEELEAPSPKTNYRGFGFLGRNDTSSSAQSPYGSIAPSAVSVASEQESELGQIQEAFKRDFSIRSPNKIQSSNRPDKSESGQLSPKSNRNDTPRRRSSFPNSIPSRKDFDRSTPSPTSKNKNKKDINNPTTPSPLRPGGSEGRRRSLTITVSPARSLSPFRIAQAVRQFTPSLKSLRPPGLPLMSRQVSSNANVNTTTSSHLRNEVSLYPSSSSGGSDETVPMLAPSKASDSASSDSHLESPPLIHPSLAVAAVNMPDSTYDIRMDNNEESIPIPISSVTSIKDDQDKWDLNHSNYPNQSIHQDHSKEQMYMLHPNDHIIPSRSHSPLSIHSIRSHQSHRSARSGHSVQSAQSGKWERSGESPSEDSTHSSTSILPSVRNKIQQLESRQKALKNFTVASASTRLYDSPQQINTNSPTGSPANKRRSYTAALAPREVQPVSRDLYKEMNSTGLKQRNSSIGHTTYVGRKSYSSPWDKDRATQWNNISTWGRDNERDQERERDRRIQWDRERSGGMWDEDRGGNMERRRSNSSTVSNAEKVLIGRNRWGMKEREFRGHVAEETDDSEGLL